MKEETTKKFSSHFVDLLNKLPEIDPNLYKSLPDDPYDTHYAWICAGYTPEKFRKYIPVGEMRWSSTLLRYLPDKVELSPEHQSLRTFLKLLNSEHIHPYHIPKNRTCTPNVNTELSKIAKKLASVAQKGFPKYPQFTWYVHSDNVLAELQVFQENLLTEDFCLDRTK